MKMLHQLHAAHAVNPHSHRHALARGALSANVKSKRNGQLVRVWRVRPRKRLVPCMRIGASPTASSNVINIIALRPAAQRRCRMRRMRGGHPRQESAAREAAIHYHERPLLKG